MLQSPHHVFSSRRSIGALAHPVKPRVRTIRPLPRTKACLARKGTLVASGSSRHPCLRCPESQLPMCTWYMALSEKLQVPAPMVGLLIWYSHRANNPLGPYALATPLRASLAMRVASPTRVAPW